MSRTMADLAKELDILWCDTEDIESTGTALVEFRGAGSKVLLPSGDPGVQGFVGEDAPSFRWRGVLASAGLLPEIALDGDGWLVSDTNRVWVWRKTSWVDAGRVIGPRGEQGITQAFDESLTFTTAAPGTPAEVSVKRFPTLQMVQSPAGSGFYAVPADWADDVDGFYDLDSRLVESDSAPGLYAFHAGGVVPNERLSFTVPRGNSGPPGVQGIPGPTAALRESTDYDDSNPPADGATFSWNALSERWSPFLVQASLRGPWHFPGEGAGWVAAASGQSAVEKTIATFTIPAQEFPWRPWVFGQVRVTTGGSASMGAKVTVGSAAGQKVAYNMYSPPALGALAPIRLTPQFQGGVDMTGDDTTTGVVPAGQPGLLYVQLFRSAGSSNYAHSPVGSFLNVFLLPV